MGLERPALILDQPGGRVFGLLSLVETPNSNTKILFTPYAPHRHTPMRAFCETQAYERKSVMSESPQKLIPFAKIFEIAAIHIFGDPSLLEFIPDEKSLLVSPENMRKKSQEAAIQLSLLRSKHAEIKKALAAETDLEARLPLESQRDKLQAEIHATLQIWVPEPLLRDYAERYEKAQRASIILEKLHIACAGGKIALFLNSAIELPRDIISRTTGVRFLPKDSILKCEIDGETRSGIVFGDENETREWLACEDIAAGIYSTPDNRKKACAAQYEARILDPLTCNCTKEEHFIALKTRITGLRRKEFDSVHRSLARKHTQISEGGRPRKTPTQI